MFYKQHINVLLLAVLSVTASVAQTIYYVDGTNGSDSNYGTSTLTAFKTIQKCASTVVAGDTCSIRGGTYRETITPAHSGTSGNPITFAPYATNETVIISGADVVPGPWTVSSGNIYTTQSMSWNVEAFNGSTVTTAFPLYHMIAPLSPAKRTIFHFSFLFIYFIIIIIKQA